MYSREVLPTDSTIKGVGFWGKSYRSFRVKSEGLQVMSLGQTTQKNPAYAGICLFMKLKKNYFEAVFVVTDLTLLMVSLVV